MPGRKTKKEKQIFENKPNPRNSWSDFLRLDESYTSLILGIIVVIIGSILLVTFVKNKNANTVEKATSSISIAPTQVYNIPLTISPTISETVSSTVVPTETSTPVATFAPSLTPTNGVVLSPTPITVQPQRPIKGSVYVVKPGDDLWHIAEMKYGSGYNWVDIAKANTLTNPGLLYSGMKLTLPTVAPKISSSTNTVQKVINPNIIRGNSYIVQKGDSLWSIAERAYNDGYQWVKIRDANHLASPNIIFSGNVLTLPRNN